MKAKTRINTFALFAAVTYVAFGLEIVLFSFLQGGAANLSGVIPLTSLPIVAHDIRGDQSRWLEGQRELRTQIARDIPAAPELEVNYPGQH